MENKEYLISLCKHYKGEDVCPDIQDSIWRYERFWVEANLEENADFGPLLEGYLNAGLMTFNQYDQTPITLKAVLYNRFMQQSEGMARTDDFMNWYDRFYL